MERKTEKKKRSHRKGVGVKWRNIRNIGHHHFLQQKPLRASFCFTHRSSTSPCLPSSLDASFIAAADLERDLYHAPPHHHRHVHLQTSVSNYVTDDVLDSFWTENNCSCVFTSYCVGVMPNNVKSQKTSALTHFATTVPGCS